MNFPNQCVQRNPDIAYRIIDNKALIVVTSNEGDNKLLMLNSTGTHVWELADGRDINSIVDKICTKFQVKRERAKQDVIAFVREFTKRGLLTAKNMET